MKQEITDLRSRFVKQYDVGGNKREAVVYPQAVHYEETGEWKDIDNTLQREEQAEGAVWKNTGSPLHLEFAENCDADELVRLEYEGSTLQWGPAIHGMDRGVEPGKAIVENHVPTEEYPRDYVSEVYYTDAMEGVDLKYRLEGLRCKEDIIVKDRGAADHVVMRLQGDGIECRQAEDGSIRIWQNGREVFDLAAPIAQDSGKGEEQAVRLEIEEDGQGVLLIYRLDPEYLDSAVYPVVIDPTITVNNTNNLAATYVNEVSPTTNYSTGQYLLSGYQSASNQNAVTLLRYSTLVPITAGDTIVNADLAMGVRQTSDSAANPKYVGLYEVTKNWDASNVTWENFNPPSGLNSKAQDAILRTDMTWVHFDITNLCRKWYRKDGSGSLNHGAALKRPELEGNTMRQYVQFYRTGTYAPVLKITYVSHVGLDGRWDYQSLSAGRAGTMSAGLFNGNLVASHGDVSLENGRGPVNIAHSYNSCECQSDGNFCGNGWRTSMNQSVYSESLDDTTRYVWTDGSGRRHYFPITGSSPYADDEGEHLKLTYNSTTVTVRDLQDTVMTFTKNGAKYWLTSVTDVLGNTVSVNYVSVGKINRVTDPTGRYIQYSYNSAGRLSTLRAYTASGADAGYPYCSFSYTGALLTGITYSDQSAGSTYTYSDNLLTSMTNYDGLSVNATYESVNDYNEAAFSGSLGRQALRVKSLEQKNGTTAGARLLFDYRHMTTHVTVVENTNSDSGKELIYQFSDQGQIRSVRDAAGYAVYNTYDASHPNYPDVTSSLQQTVVNLLKNHRFDTTGSWTTSLANGATGTHSYATDQKFMGSKSAKMVRTNAAGEMIITQSVAVTNGQTYTFSAWGRSSLDALTVRARVTCGGTVYEGMPQRTTGEWSRLHVTFTATAGTAQVALVAAGAAGSAWFDCAQLELGEVANRYNLLENGNFEYGTGNVPESWTAQSGNSTQDTAQTCSDGLHPSYLGSRVMKLHGVPNQGKGIWQELAVSGAAKDLYTVGGWARAESRPVADESRRFCIRAQFYNSTNGWLDGGEADFNEEWTDWQYASGFVKAPHSYTKIRVYVDYQYNVNDGQFDGVGLYREAFGEQHTYNSDGRLTHTRNLSGNEDTRYYDSKGNLSGYTAAGAGTYTTQMHYDFSEPEKKHLIRYSNSPMNVQHVYDYDAYGNVTAHKRQTSSPTIAVRETNTYTSDGSHLASHTNPHGCTVSYTYNTNDTVQKVTAPNGQTATYSYDGQRRLTGVQATVGGTVRKNTYTYTNDRLSGVGHNTTGDAADVNYSFTYDSLGKPTQVKVGTVALTTNAYGTDRLQKLTGVTYANGAVQSFDYDAYGRLTGSKFNGDSGWRYRYAYAANGQVGKIQDNYLNRTIWNEFDRARRPERITERATNGDLIHQVTLGYDGQERLSTMKEKVAALDYQSAFTYDNDNRLTQVKHSNSDNLRVRYTYDKAGRVATRKLTNTADVTTTYSYLGSPNPIPGLSHTSSTDLVSGMSQSGVSFTYGYASNTDNITSEVRTNGSFAGTTTYVYDTLGQLTRVNDPKDTRGGTGGTSWVYEYDRGGNITAKKRYAYTTGTLGSVQQTISYTYGDSNWKDKLTGYNGTSLSYDAQGNLTGDGTRSYTWICGRQLRKVVNGSSTATYTYNHNGLRMLKNVDGTTWHYIWHGDQLTHVINADGLHFYYDGTGRLSHMTHNGTWYGYLFNLQGDVIGILDTSGNLVVEY